MIINYDIILTVEDIRNLQKIRISDIYEKQLLSTKYCTLGGAKSK